MLYSSKYKFVYSKTVKTASTSCEVALEYLIRGGYAPHHTNSLLFEDGSRIGYRGNAPTSDPNFGTPRYSKNHQSLKQTKEQITPNEFDLSYKISSIRNPYDRLVSHFHFHRGNNNPLEEFVSLKKIGRIDRISQKFEDYLLNGPSRYTARQHWHIGSNMLIDKFVRMEYLREDISDILNHLSVSPEISKKILSKIPQFKNSGRSDTCLNISDYFTDRSLELVNERYSDWFLYGSYVKHNSVIDLEYCR